MTPWEKFMKILPTIEPHTLVELRLTTQQLELTRYKLTSEKRPLYDPVTHTLAVETETVSLLDEGEEES